MAFGDFGNWWENIDLLPGTGLVARGHQPSGFLRFDNEPVCQDPLEGAGLPIKAPEEPPEPPPPGQLGEQERQGYRRDSQRERSQLGPFGQFLEGSQGEAILGAKGRESYKVRR